MGTIGCIGLIINSLVPIADVSVTVSPHKVMGIYTEVLILGVIHQYMVSASFSCFLWALKS